MFVPLHGTGCGPLPLMAMCPRWGENQAWGSLICHTAHNLKWLASGAQFAISSGELRRVPRAHKTVCSQQSVLSPCRARGVAHSLSWQCALDGERATGLRPSSSRSSVLQRGRGPGVCGPLPLMATCTREGESLRLPFTQTQVCLKDARLRRQEVGPRAFKAQKRQLQNFGSNSPPGVADSTRDAAGLGCQDSR